MPTFLGAGRAGIIGGSVGGATFGTQDNPITTDAEGALWGASTGSNSGPAYVQKAGLNGGNPYEVYCIYSSSKLWVMAGVFAGNDSTNGPSGFFRWCPVKNPNTANSNDWGTSTHTFNDNYDFTSYNQNNRSARSRAWAELATNKSRFYFFNQAQTSALIYTFGSTSAGGENASWGTRMKTVSDYFKNGGTNQISSSDIVKSLPSGTVTDERWRKLGLGATDAEATSANTNDIIMLVAQGSGASGTSTDWNNSSPGYGGLGVKRSQVSGEFPSNFTFNGTSGDSKAGVIATPGSYNGTISFDTDGYITIYQALV
jgi:hypothetical protein